MASPPPDQMAHMLQRKLSPGAEVYLPCSEEFDNLTKRWSALEKPEPNVVVVPANEQDVVTTV